MKNKPINIVDIKSAIKKGQLEVQIKNGFVYLRDTESQEQIVLFVAERFESEGTALGETDKLVFDRRDK